MRYPAIVENQLGPFLYQTTHLMSAFRVQDSSHPFYKYQGAKAQDMHRDIGHCVVAFTYNQGHISRSFAVNP